MKVQTIPKKRYLRFGYYLRGPQDLTPFPHKMKYRAVIPPLMTEGITCKIRDIISSIKPKSYHRLQSISGSHEKFEKEVLSKYLSI